jgi:hypothetical protein
MGLDGGDRVCQEGPAPEELPLKKLKGRAAFLFMVLLPCRPAGMWKMDVLRERWAEDEELVEVAISSEVEVNACTGHSNNSHTAPNNCLYLRWAWVNQELLG